MREFCHHWYGKLRAACACSQWEVLSPEFLKGMEGCLQMVPALVSVGSFPVSGGFLWTTQHSLAGVPPPAPPLGLCLPRALQCPEHQGFSQGFRVFLAKSLMSCNLSLPRMLQGAVMQAAAEATERPPP